MALNADLAVFKGNVRLLRGDDDRMIVGTLEFE
jgi:hypothetical protein